MRNGRPCKYSRPWLSNLKVLSLSRYTLFDTILVTDLKYSWKFSLESSLMKESNFDDKTSNSAA